MHPDIAPNTTHWIPIRFGRREQLGDTTQHVRASACPDNTVFKSQCHGAHWKSLANIVLFFGNGLHPLHQLLELIRKCGFVAAHGALEERC